MAKSAFSYGNELLRSWPRSTREAAGVTQVELAARSERTLLAEAGLKTLAYAIRR